MRLGTNALRAALVATALVGVAACGSGDSDGGDDFTDQSATEIKDATIKDMKAVKSLTMDGTVEQGGQEIKLNLSADTDGTCAGEISQQGWTAEFIGGDETFIKANEDFWRSNFGANADQILALVGDKWAKVPEEAAASFDSFCDLDSFISEFTKDDDDSDVKKGDTDEVDGEDAIIIEGTTDDGDPSKAWIAVDGKHRILKLEGEGDAKISFAFTDYDEPVDADAPPSDEVVDLSQQG